MSALNISDSIWDIATDVPRDVRLKQIPRRHPANDGHPATRPCAEANRGRDAAYEGTVGLRVIMPNWIAPNPPVCCLPTTFLTTQQAKGGASG